MRVYYDRDADFGFLRNKKILIIGYGSQGRAHALNLRDSGAEHVGVALRADSATRAVAIRDGFSPITVREGVPGADMVMMLCPDETQADMYHADIARQISHGSALVFAHGFNIHFQLIEPRSDLDVFMVAPKGPGHLVRSEYERGRGVPCLVAMHCNPERDGARNGACLREWGRRRSGRHDRDDVPRGVRDRFVRGASGFMRWFVGVDRRRIRDAGGGRLCTRDGIFRMSARGQADCGLVVYGRTRAHAGFDSNTAEYGDYTTGSRIVDGSVRRRMRAVLREIQDGTFARNWVSECKCGQPRFKAMRRRAKEHSIEEVGRRLRGMMPWLREDRNPRLVEPRRMPRAQVRMDRVHCPYLVDFFVVC